MIDPATEMTFGAELRRRRETRRYSQLALAAAADVSQRHLSFLETGRSRPSREMVLHLARTLELSLRDQNSLLSTAGHRPEHAERPFDDPGLDRVRHGLTTMVDALGPIPAHVVDGGWDIVLANRASRRLGAVAGIDVPPGVAGNLMRLYLHPDGLGLSLADRGAGAAALVRRLEREVAERPFDERLAALVTEVCAYPEVVGLGPRPAPSGADAAVPLVVAGPLGELRFVSVVATIDVAVDVTLEELRMETLLPADRRTETVLRSAVDPGAGS